MTWLKDRLPATVYEQVQAEARRVAWPFLEGSVDRPFLEASADRVDRPDPPAEEPMSSHPKWAQLQDVIKDGFKARGGGKLRRVTAEQRREGDVLAGELIREAGELSYNDSLLLVSRRLNTPLEELVQEWDF